MIIHQDVAIQLSVGSVRLFVQHGQLLRPVNATPKAGEAAFAVLDDRLRDAWEVESGLPGHARGLAETRIRDAGLA